MDVIRIVAALVGSLGLGAVLAAPISWPFPPGILGGLALLAAAGISKRVWETRRAAELDAPSWREIGAWHSVVGWGLVCGQLTGSLLRGDDLHLGAGNTLAIDNWCLAVAAVGAWLILRPRDRTRDERDRAMESLGARTGYWVLTLSLVVASLGIGFAPEAAQARLTPFVIGNILIVLILVGGLAWATGQLVGYWAASRPVRDDP